MLEAKLKPCYFWIYGRYSRNYFGNLEESEGVLMIIAYDSLFGYVNIIVFQLANWIAIVSKSSEEVLKERKNTLAFSYLAIPTRHPV